MTEIEWGSPASLRACAEWSEAESKRAWHAAHAKSVQTEDRDYYLRRANRLDLQAASLWTRAEAQEYAASDIGTAA